MGEWRYSSTHSLPWALDGGEWSASRPGRFTSRERAPGTHWIRGSVGPSAVLDTVVMRKILSARRESNPRTPVVQAIAQRYTDWVITALRSSVLIFRYETEMTKGFGFWVVLMSALFWGESCGIPHFIWSSNPLFPGNVPDGRYNLHNSWRYFIGSSVSIVTRLRDGLQGQRQGIFLFSTSVSRLALGPTQWVPAVLSLKIK
jgi:hypothetical protein